MMFLENPHVKKIILTTMIFMTLMLVIAGSGFLFEAARAQTAPTPTPTAAPVSMDEMRTISVSGTGIVSVEPDRVIIIVGVESQSETAGQAMEANNQSMQALIEALLAAGAAEEDMQTQSVALFPQYEESPQPDASSRQITGYIAHNTIRVQTDDVDGLGALLDAAIEAGGNTIHGVQFEVSDPSTALDEARRLAWESALHKAEQLALLAGAELGPVLTMTEYSISPRPVGQDLGRDEAVGGSTPVLPGTRESQVNLDVTWQLGSSNDEAEAVENP